MKKRLFLMVTMVIVLVVVGFSFSISKKNFSDEDEIVEIYFPEYAGELDENLEIVNNIDFTKIKNVEYLKEYYKVKTINNEKEICKQFKMNQKDKVDLNTKKSDGVTIIKDGKKKLKLYDNGAFYYKKENAKNKRVDLSDDECMQIAENFLEESELKLQDFEYSGVGYDILTDLENESQEVVVAKNIYYSRTLNELDVYGNSKIMISVTADGEISEVYSSYGDINEQIKTKKKNIVPIEVAVDKAINMQGFIDCPLESKKIVLESVEIVYWEDSVPESDNNTIQPVYKIIGSAYEEGKYIGEVSIIEAALK